MNGIAHPWRVIVVPLGHAGIGCAYEPKLAIPVRRRANSLQKIFIVAITCCCQPRIEHRWSTGPWPRRRTRTKSLRAPQQTRVDTPHGKSCTTFAGLQASARCAHSRLGRGAGLPTSPELLRSLGQARQPASQAPVGDPAFGAGVMARKRHPAHAWRAWDAQEAVGATRAGATAPTWWAGRQGTGRHRVLPRGLQAEPWTACRGWYLRRVSCSPLVPVARRRSTLVSIA